MNTKTTTKLLALAAILALGGTGWAPAQADAKTVAQTYQIGLDALKEGNTVLARQCFQAILQKQPQHANARYQLLNLGKRGPELAAKARQVQLAKIKIPKVDFNNARLPEALEALAVMIDKESAGAFAPNFIVQDPAGVFAGYPITLTLNQVPAKVVLDYLLNLSNGKARFDEHAIVVTPIGGGGGAKPPAADDGKEAPDPFAK